jgi:glycosidase
VGEIFHGDPEVTSFFAGGEAHLGIDTGLDTPFDFPVYFALRDVLTAGQPMTELDKVLRQDALYPHPERLVTFIGNHDTSRFITAADGSAEKLKLAIGLILTLRGMPLIYSGDEIGMPGGNDPDDRRDFPGGFAGDAHNAFVQAGRTPAQQEIFRWSSSLLALRAAHTVLQTGLEQNLFANDDVFAFVRTPDGAGCATDHASERMLIVVNKAPHAETIDLPTDDTALAGCRNFHAMAPAGGADPVAGGGTLHLEQPAESIAIFKVN